MNKKEFFVAACKAERWRWRAWRISLFAITRLSKKDALEHFDLEYREDGVYFYNTHHDWTLITDSVPNEPLLDDREAVTFPPDSIPTHPGELETTYGRFLFNWTVMYFAFKDKLPYVQNSDAEAIVESFASRVVDETLDENDEVVVDPAGGLTAPIYPSELSNFTMAIFELTSLCPYITPTGSTKSLTTHPEMVATRDALLIKYKDELDDPAVIATIQGILIELDKEWLKDDSSEGYYLDKSSFNVKRKKLFAMHGIEGSFKTDGTYDLIAPSLSEGQGLLNLVARYNSIREGSRDRGGGTALGGEKVTFLQRLFLHVTIEDGDCGTKLTWPVLLTKQALKKYNGLNHVVNGKPVRLTEESGSSYLNKVVYLRRPILCKHEGISYCSTCCSSIYVGNPRAVAANIVGIASAIMYVFMASMHGVELAVSHYDYKTSIK